MKLPEIVALLLVLMLAAALRFGWPGVNSFAFDEARLSLISLEMARGGQFAALGMPSSAGVPNPPAAAWIFALPYALSPDPLIATLFVGLLSLATVAGTWWLARGVWGVWAALAVALILAASPYTVLYARNIWAQNLLPPLSLAWVWTAYASIQTERRWTLALHVFLTGFIFQVHLAGAGLALGTAYLFLRWRWYRRLGAVLIGGALAVLAFLPFLVTLLSSPDVAAGFSTALREAPQIDLIAFRNLLILALGIDWDYLAAGVHSPDTAHPLLIGLAAALLIGGLLALLRDLRGANHEQRQRRPFAELILVWALVTPLFFLRHSTPVFPHYLLPSLLPLVLVMGAGFFRRSSQAQSLSLKQKASSKEAGAANPLTVKRDSSGLATPSPLSVYGEGVWGWGETRRLYSPFLNSGRGLGGGVKFVALLLPVLILTLAWTLLLSHSLTVAGQIETPNGLGTPLKQLRAAAYNLPADVPALLFTHGDNPNIDGEAAIFEVLWWDRPHRIIQGNSVLILPEESVYLMATLAPFPAWEELEISGLVDDPLTFDRREGALPFVATHYDGATQPAGFRPVEPVLFEDGAQLEGWRTRRIGDRLRISTLWRVIDPPPNATIQQFHHLRAVGNDELLIGADVPLSMERWQVGGRVIVMGDFFDVPPGRYTVDIGHYTLPDVVRIPHAKNADFIRLDPFEL